MDEEELLYREMNPEDEWYMGPKDDEDDCDYEESDEDYCNNATRRTRYSRRRSV